MLYPETPVSDYAEWFFPAMTLVNQNKSLFTDNFSSSHGRLDLEKDELNNEVQLYSDYSYQFDATKFGIWLRDNYCKAKYTNNFTHILAEVKEIPLNDNGIEHLILDNGQKLEADLFIDCTGFKSLLLTKAFGVPFITIENYIPNNYAWATKIPYKDPETQIVNYTNCTAIENGWIWEIPLWSRMGSGYVFSDKFISTQAALREFKQGLRKKGYENVEDLEYHLIPMRCGYQSKLWVKNTCAIGLSAGFIEPLQSNGLLSIHYFIFNLLRTLSRGHISEWDRREFNAKCHDDFYTQAHIVALSYVLSHRDDTEYWRHIQNKNWLVEKNTTMFKLANARAIEHNFTHLGSGIHAIATGMHYSPVELSEAMWLDLKNKDMLAREWAPNIENLNQRKNKWEQAAKKSEKIYDFLKRYIYNE